jgi:hypothetical protein
MVGTPSHGGNEQMNAPALTPPLPGPALSTVFVGGLPTWVSSGDLRGWLSDENLSYIRACVLPGKNIAFIDCRSAVDRDLVIEWLDGAELEDPASGSIRRLRASIARPRPDHRSDHRPATTATESR